MKTKCPIDINIDINNIGEDNFISFHDMPKTNFDLCAVLSVFWYIDFSHYWR